MAKAKIPKRVAGVKVPKKLRKQAKQALKLTGSGAVRDLAIAGLTLAAERALEAMRAAGAGKKTRASLDALDLGEVMRAAAAEGARRFLEGYEAARAKPPAAPRKPVAPRKPAKPRKPVKPRRPVKPRKPAG
ncbi:MAG TPA: hypothetical protein VES64_01570 [Allosphingosinicella sp.]|nr:hypothetical protein [Allosphingosinicella sp.]